ERKKSKVWEAKMVEIQKHVSSSRASLASARSSAVDIMDNRSECVDMEEEYGTIRSKVSVTSRNGDGSQRSLDAISPAMPVRPSGNADATTSENGAAIHDATAFTQGTAHTAAVSQAIAAEVVSSVVYSSTSRPVSELIVASAVHSLPSRPVSDLGPKRFPVPSEPPTPTEQTDAKGA
ncbi:UNVERIFIED_CONTAM: hypothetical protein HDU68_010073, partial [Siphonaria sp. JEL0065]